MIVTTGFLADFKTGYLQIAVPEHRCEVINGTDDADRDGNGSGVTAGFVAGRLVRLYRHSDGSCLITAASSVSATSIGDATHIIAQTDDSLDTKTIKGEQLNFAATTLLKNTSAETTPGNVTAATATMKRVALWKITNSDDVKIIEVKPSTVSVVR